MATGVSAPGRAQIKQKTLRTDRWWLAPLRIGVILGFFVVYATVRIFMNKYYWVDAYHYLTPLYSPCVTSSCVEGSSHLGTWFGDFPRVHPVQHHHVRRTGRLPRHLLLLPQGGLAVAAARTGRLRGAGAAQEVQR